MLDGIAMLELLLSIALLGLIVWLIETYIPMSPPFLTIFRVVVGICLILWLLRVFGVADIPVPRLR